MLINKLIKFQLNVSAEGYQKKSDASACLSRKGAESIGKTVMAFRQKELTTDKFIELALNGHCFCGLFSFDPNSKYWLQVNGKPFLSYPVFKRGSLTGAMKLAFKRDEFFHGNYCVFIDVDYTRFQTIPEYLQCLSLQPTCAYPSFSDGAVKDGVASRRFRMVYIFNQELVGDEWVRIARAITHQIEMDTQEPMMDDCGTRRSQYMNGVYGTTEVYCSYTIYEPSDFPLLDVPAPTEVVDADEPETDASIGASIQFNPALLYEMAFYSYEDFTHFNSWRYTFYYRTEKDEWMDMPDGLQGQYQMTEPGYIQLWWHREKVFDTNRRRRRLLKRACLRRLIRPEVDPDTLLYNMYIDAAKICDNSDGVLTVDTLVFYTRKAMAMSYEDTITYCQLDLQYMEANRPMFITRGVSSGDISRLSKYLNWQQMDEHYDQSKSVQENAQTLGVSESTIYRYCRDRGLTPSTVKEDKIAKFVSLYDVNKTVRENQELMNANGLGLSRGTVQNWAKLYLGQEEQEVNEERQEWNWNISQYLPSIGSISIQ